MLAEYLPGRDFFCQTLWRDGRLMLVKTCERISYFAAENTPSGVSSLYSLAKTVVDERERTERGGRSMGNEPGPLEKGESSTVLLKLIGRVDAMTAQYFTEALEALIAEYRPQMGGIERPIKDE